MTKINCMEDQQAHPKPSKLITCRSPQLELLLKDEAPWSLMADCPPGSSYQVSHLAQNRQHSEL